MSDSTATRSLDVKKLYLAVGRSQGDNSRFQIQPFDGQAFVPPVTLGGEAWGKTYGATATAFTEIDEVTYLAVGRSEGSNSRFQIYPFGGVSLGSPISGGDDWGSSRATTALAFTGFQGVTYLAVGRNEGDNSRFQIYSFDGGTLEPITAGGNDWGSSRAATGLAFTEIDGMCYLAVGQSEGDNSRFQIYPFTGTELGTPVDGGEDWGSSRGATAVAFTQIDGACHLAVGRSQGDNSRFQIYPFDGTELGSAVSGGDDWGNSRGATGLSFFELSGVTYLAVGRNQGDGSRFQIYPFSGTVLAAPTSGGDDWGKSYAATALAVGNLDGKAYLAVGRSKGDSSRYKVYSFDGHFLEEKADGGGDWGSSRATTAVAIA